MDADDDHIKGADIKQAIERKNYHKIKYLQNENNNIKALYEDSVKNLDINKNIIQMLVESQENKAKMTEKEKKENLSNVIKRLNQENVNLVG